MEDFEDLELVAAALLDLRYATWTVQASHSPAAMMDLPLARPRPEQHWQISDIKVAPSPPATMESPPAWVCYPRRPRTKRSRTIGDRKDLIDSKRRLRDLKAVVASKRNPIPNTPLECPDSSGASQSSSKGVEAKRTCTKGPTGGGYGGVADQQTKVVTGEREPSISKISDPKQINRSSTKKKTKLQLLQSIYQSLLEQREFLQKEVKALWRSKMVMETTNWELKKRLKLKCESKKRLGTATPVPEKVHPKRLRLCDT